MKKFFNQKIKIGKTILGKKFKTFIIAEIGINHKGKFKVCKQMIAQAKRSGADAAKIQIVNPEESYEKKTKSYDLFRKAQLTYKELVKLKKFAQKLDIILFATPGDLHSLSIIKKLKFPLIKISSSNLNNHLLVEQILKSKLPVIASTGMAQFNEIKNFLQTAKNFKNKNIILLSCKSVYPAKDAILNLKSILSIKKSFKTITGYSDHTEDELSCMIAVASGAQVIEKHFTVDKKIRFADYKISSDPQKFKLMVNKIRRIELMLGNGKILPSKEEFKNRHKFRRFIVAKSNIKKGETFKLHNITLKRILPRKKALNSDFLKKIIGKKSKMNIKKNEIIKKNSFYYEK